MAPQSSSGAEPQNGSAERPAAFRHHIVIIADDPAEYLDEFGKEWVMPFAVENDDEAIWNLVGGTTAMPQTIVLNRHGEAVYNQRGSVTPEMLATLYEQASEQQETSG